MRDLDKDVDFQALVERLKTNPEADIEGVCRLIYELAYEAGQYDRAESEPNT